MKPISKDKGVPQRPGTNAPSNAPKASAQKPVPPKAPAAAPAPPAKPTAGAKSPIGAVKPTGAPKPSGMPAKPSPPAANRPMGAPPKLPAANAAARSAALKAEDQLKAPAPAAGRTADLKAAQAAKPAPAPAAPDKPAVLAEYTVVSGDTLSGISQKFYKSGAREKWMKIYEANKAVIGANPGMIKAGQKLIIPKLD
jgi:LysM repeat protein